MIIEQVITNLENISASDIKKLHIERVYLASDDLVKRIQRVTTDHGREIGIRLQAQQDLMDGDVLYMDDETLIVVAVKPDDLLVIRPQSLQQMGEIAHHLGNRHLPAQFEKDQILVQYDYLIENLLQELGIPFTREERKVKKAFRHIGHHHD